MNAKFQELLTILEREYDEDCFAAFGLRQASGQYEVGQSLDNSFVWVDGETTDEELNGVCTMGIKNADEKNLELAIRNLGYEAANYFGVQNKKYHTYDGNVFLLVKGDSAISGEDFGESIIENPVVVAVFEM